MISTATFVVEGEDTPFDDVELPSMIVGYKESSYEDGHAAEPAVGGRVLSLTSRVEGADERR